MTVKTESEMLRTVVSAAYAIVRHHVTEDQAIEVLDELETSHVALIDSLGEIFEWGEHLRHAFKAVDDDDEPKLRLVTTTEEGGAA